MTVYFKYIICHFIFLALFSCKAQKDMISPNDCFTIGSGGGVTGIYFEYLVCGNGEVKEFDFNLKEYRSHSIIDKKNLHHFFDEFKKINFDDHGKQHPGNYNYYLIKYDSDQRKKILWGDRKYKMDENIVKFYDELNAYIRSKNPER